MALERFDYDRYHSRDIRDEYDRVMRQLHDMSRELEHWKERALSGAGESEYLKREIATTNRYIRVLELALHLASGSDSKKAEFLESAKKSIEVLKTFEK